MLACQTTVSAETLILSSKHCRRRRRWPTLPLPRLHSRSEREKLLLDTHRLELDEARAKAQELEEASARNQQASHRDMPQR